MDRNRDFMIGRGVIRTKHSPVHGMVMVTGRIALPGAGQCFVSGTYADTAKSVSLDILKADTRAVIAKLNLPRNGENIRGGMVESVETTEVKKRGKVTLVPVRFWKCLATLRQGDLGPYFSIQLPDVKAVGSTVQ